MLSMAPWMVPLGIILVSLVFMFAVLAIDKKLEANSNTAAWLSVLTVGVILMAFGSLVTVWLL